ncbi:hypothetical protein J3B02_002982, partial [Coemansia erecta]
MQNSTAVEMLDQHTSVTRSVLRKPVVGCSREFAHERDLLMVETSLVDPTTAIYVATSLDTTMDDPVYLREHPGVKRVRSDLWAWCVEIATPLAAATPEMMLRQQQQQQQQQQRGRGKVKRKPVVCVRVTCFLHLELGSWRSYDQEACRAAVNLIPALVAYLRLHGAPPRLARVGPAVIVDRRDWIEPIEESDEGPRWDVACSLADPSATTQMDGEQSVVARILQMQASGGGRSSSGEHALTSYLSSSLRRKQTEGSGALGTHGGGILRDGEAMVVAATRAWVGNSIVEFIVDASHWVASEGYHGIEITLDIEGLVGQGLRESILRAQISAPELFTAVQRDLLDTAECEGEMAALLVRCFRIESMKSSCRRYLVRVVMPPPMLDIITDDENDAVSTVSGDRPEREGARGIRVTVRRGKHGDDGSGSGSGSGSDSMVLVNGRLAEIMQYSLDPTEHHPKPFTKPATPQFPVSLCLDRQRPRLSADPQRSCQRIKQRQDTSELDRETTPVVLDGTESEPLSRLRSIQQIAPDGWTSLSGGSAETKLSRNDPSVEKTSGHFVVRLETVLEGWTVFDVLGVIQQMPRTGLWDSQTTATYETPMVSMVQCEAKGNWAAQARSTAVNRVWTTDGRRRVEIAECSVSDQPITNGDVVVADVRLAAWVLETAAVMDDVADGRKRSASVATMLTDLAADVEAANWRKRQHAVRITRYLQYNPGGWLDSSDDKSVGAPLRKLGAAQLSKDAVITDDSLIRQLLGTSGAVPGLVWARNIQMVQTQYLDNHEGVVIRYRLSSVEHRAAIELRIEHRVWARQQDSAGSAAVRVSVVPWGSSGCSIACFVDPDADPHATRIRIRHSRDQLMPRTDTQTTAWPVVTIRVTRTGAHVSESGERPGWSVPPRVQVNGVEARVRYLRRSDSDDSALFTRCASIASRDMPRMQRVSEDVVIDDAPSSSGDAASDATPKTADKQVVQQRDSPSMTSVAVLGYSKPETALTGGTLVSAEKFAELAARVFADARHDIGSDRTRWHELRGRPTTNSWEHRQADSVDVFTRLVDDVHGEIPVVVALTVLQRTEAAWAMQAVMQPWMRLDHALVASRRTLETVTAGTTIEHVQMQTPLLCDRRDTLTVRRVELAPFMPVRQRLKTWQTGNWACGRRGDFTQPTLTVVEASVPQSQPLRSVTRALVPMFAVRVEPIDGFERIASGCPELQHPACRLFVACCVDLAGSLPLAIRRAWSMRVPELVVAQVRQLLLAQNPTLGPWLLAPLMAARVVPRGTSGDRSHAVRDVVCSVIDGRPRRFARSLDQQLVVDEENSRDGKYSVSVRLPQYPEAPLLAETLPAVADIHVPAPCFPTGLSIEISSAFLAPLAEPTMVPCGEWLGNVLRGQSLAVYVLSDGSGGKSHDALLVRLALIPSAADASDFHSDVKDHTITVSISATATIGGTPSHLVLVNGQPMRVHQQTDTDRQRMLQLVETSDGRELSVCAQCSSVMCSADPTEDDLVAADPDYLSDSLSCDENSATPVPQRTP